jgi:hypothetical protein
MRVVGNCRPNQRSRGLSMRHAPRSGMKMRRAASSEQHLAGADADSRLHQTSFALIDTRNESADHFSRSCAGNMGSRVFSQHSP